MEQYLIKHRIRLNSMVLGLAPKQLYVYLIRDKTQIMGIDTGGNYRKKLDPRFAPLLVHNS
jgi:hypothetical protein